VDCPLAFIVDFRIALTAQDLLARHAKEAGALLLTLLANHAESRNVPDVGFAAQLQVLLGEALKAEVLAEGTLFALNCNFLQNLTN